MAPIVNTKSYKQNVNYYAVPDISETLPWQLLASRPIVMYILASKELAISNLNFTHFSQQNSNRISFHRTANFTQLQ
jgi:hypothetical protein